jgi:DNA-directed RNA polymerase II subunit RPB11
MSGSSALNAPEPFLTWRWEDEDDEEVVKHEKDTKMPNTSLFILGKEDHTMGNIIRMQLLRDKRVRFAGYMMPHPTVFDCHIKVQTMEASQNPMHVFDEALEDLSEEVNRLKAQFELAYNEFNNQ